MSQLIEDDVAEVEARLLRSAAVLEEQVTVSANLHRRIIERPASVTATRHPPWRLRKRTLALALAAVALANLPVAYLLPNYANALAGAPLIGALAGPVLKDAGLAGPAITALDSVATSSGHSVRVIGGYADSVRTALFIEIDGQKPVVPSKTSHSYQVDGFLTDQFGHRYNMRYTANASVEFDPLVWPASSVGARLTLHISELLPTWKAGNPVTGNWTVHLTLFLQTIYSRNPPLPPAVIGGEVTYRITLLQLSYYSIRMHWIVGGPPVDSWRATVGPYTTGTKPIPPSILDLLAPGSEEFMRWVLVDPQGNEVQTITDWGFTYGKADATGPLDFELNGTLPGPGRYTIRFGSGDHQASESFVVPAA